MEGVKRGPNPELWHACAGPLVSLPSVGTRVVYFPQGHSEQVAASTQKEADADIPSYPNLPPHLVCQLHNITLHADIETDEVYAQMTLQPISAQEKDSFMVSDLGRQNRQPSEYFCKTLTASDTSTHGGFSIPRRAAEKVFPPLDFSQQPPAQEIVARDLHDTEWRFRHIYRGQPRRHLLTTGWSVFVSAKRLQTGDAVLFIRDEKGQLLLGIRRANRQQASMPLSLLSTDSMYIGILAAAAHANSTSSRFTIFYNPRASPSEFVIPLSKYYNAVYNSMQVSPGMRFRMQFETEESGIRRHTCTIVGSGDLDPVRWPNSHWRSLKVEWDEPAAGEKQQRISLWEIEPASTPYLVCSPSFTFRSKRPWSQALGPSPIAREVEDVDASGRKWIKSEALDKNLSWNMYSEQLMQLQQRPDSAASGTRTDFYLPDDCSRGGPEAAHSQAPKGLPMQQVQIKGQQQQQQQHQQQQQLLPPMPQQQPVHDQYNCHTQPPQQHVVQLSQQASDSVLHLSSGPQCLKQRGEADITLSSYGRSYQNSMLEQQYTRNPGEQDVIQMGMGLAKESHGWYVGEKDFTTEQPLQFGHLDGYSGSGAVFSINDIEQGVTPGLSFKDAQQQEQDALHLDSRSHLLFGVNIETECNTPSSQAPKSKDCQQRMLAASSSDLHWSSENNVNNSLEDAAYVQRSASGGGQHMLPRTFTKVYKTGSVGRSLDLTRLNCYEGLRAELARMFGLEGQLDDPHRSGWQLVFVDNENDVLLVGDDPWEEFVTCVRCIKIMSPVEVIHMNQEQLINAIQARTNDDFGSNEPEANNAGVECEDAL